MSLEIGINEGWRLGSESKITEKGGIMIHFVQGEVITDALELLESEEPDAETSSILLFPPSMEDYTTKEPRTALDIIRDIRIDYKRMYKIFNLYLTKEELKNQYPAGCMLEGMGLTKENQEALLAQESVIIAMCFDYFE